MARRPSEYTLFHYCLVHQALIPIVEQLGKGQGNAVSRQLVLLLEEAADRAGEGYTLNDQIELYLLTRATGEQWASKQYKLRFKPETMERMKALSRQTRQELRVIRTSLLLDSLERRGLI